MTEHAFDMFREKTVQAEPEKNKNIKIMPKKEKSVVKSEKPWKKVVSNVFYITAVACAVFFFLNGHMNLNEIDLAFYDKKAVLEELESEQKSLEIRCEAKKNREVVEAYAINVLHMQKAQDYQVTNVSLPKDDSVIVLEKEEKSGILKLLGDILV